MTTQMFPVQSSQISYIGFEEETNILYVTFSNNTTWAYYSVSKEVFEALKNATSVGKYFNSEIKGKYDMNKIK
jgi:hypothetical protein